MAEGRIRIGIGGWNFAAWRGSFYPEGLSQKRELEYAASRLGTIEVAAVSEKATEVAYCGERTGVVGPKRDFAPLERPPQKRHGIVEVAFRLKEATEIVDGL